ncbi:LPXTG cell wall anchor domain-containing protein [Streptomyces sp. NBC_01615]|uniref:LPXTG cell wall anchor domain-containing protein n=1 Tax=Streptomyces sp. NBC_01615 TaxID=2975898 RepID=UPI0038701A71
MSLPLALTAASASTLGSLALAPAPAHALPPVTTPAHTPSHVTAPANPRPACAAPGTRDFPIKTRIHGGPAAYDAGGDFRTWYIDLTNTTAHTCGSIHPIVVLVDGKRALRPEQARLEFYEGERPHPVTFEKSDEAESVGAFDDGFPGFTVGPGRTLTVKVRLSVTSDATAPNDVVANAAVVQRHNDDGDWVGESNDYRFRIEGEEEGEGDGGDGDGGDGDGSGVHDGAAPSADELPQTGPGAPHELGVVAGLVLFVTGATLLAVTRRARLRRR